jgi:hypothetical protein
MVAEVSYRDRRHITPPLTFNVLEDMRVAHVNQARLPHS